MVKMQEEMNQHAHDVNPPPNPHVIENPTPLPQSNPPDYIPIGTPSGVPLATRNPHVIEVDDHQYPFSSPRDSSMYEAFGPPTNEMENKVKAIKEKLRAIQSTNTLGLDAVEICLVPGVVIPSIFKVPDFEKYKGASDPRTHSRAYCLKMATYSDDDRLLMHLFQDSLSGASLDWYMHLEGTHIRT
ncbi:uncharacterized protein LOC127131972 [Lathyrus oleraceus]|uniref:uncharacterized protein LOC127131972 n=1 Tax=Pisum sativum TaxID=3888 RepID=UPI0021D39528|nr:uncharacterized protein LOC127131972 [Pisum sativum]